MNVLSARHTDRYLNSMQQTQETNTHALSGIRTRNSAIERQQTYALDCRGFGFGVGVGVVLSQPLCICCLRSVNTHSKYQRSLILRSLC